MTLAAWTAVVDQAAELGIGMVQLIGGEPLTSPHAAPLIERAVGVRRHPPRAVPRVARRHPGQVPGLLQPAGHAGGRGRAQERQPLPRRAPLSLLGHLVQDPGG